MTLETWNVISMSPHWFHLALLLCRHAMRILQVYWTFFRFMFVSQHSCLVTIKLSLMAVRIVYLSVFYVMQLLIVSLTAIFVSHYYLTLF